MIRLIFRIWSNDLDSSNRKTVIFWYPMELDWKVAPLLAQLAKIGMLLQLGEQSFRVFDSRSRLAKCIELGLNAGPKLVPCHRPGWLSDRYLGSGQWLINLRSR